MDKDRAAQTASPWSQWKEDIRVRLWTAFVAAGLESMAFFAYFDPLMQGSDELPPSWLEHRPMVYAIGLASFWALTVAVSALNAYLPVSGLLPESQRRSSGKPA